MHRDQGQRQAGAPSVPVSQNGDTVYILTSRTARGPSLDWLNPNLGYVKTTSARESIKQWFNRQERRINIQRGRDAFEKQLRRLNTAIDGDEAAKLMKFDTAEEFFAV